MKKCLFFLLLVALLLQMTWSIAAAYCQHEKDKVAQHFGHHVHQHVMPQNKADSDNASSLGTQSHADCASCHWSTAGFVMPFQLALSSNLTAASPPESVFFLRSIDLAEPERPQWVGAI